MTKPKEGDESKGYLNHKVETDDAKVGCHFRQLFDTNGSEFFRWHLAYTNVELQGLRIVGYISRDCDTISDGSQGYLIPRHEKI